jgi:hypothetical protein
MLGFTKLAHPGIIFTPVQPQLLMEHRIQPAPLRATASSENEKARFLPANRLSGFS